jgi:hypothetical protein
MLAVTHNIFSMNSETPITEQQAMIELNNQGAFSIENGDYTDALHKLTDALKVSRQITSSFDTVQEDGEQLKDDEKIDVDSESSLDFLMAKACTAAHGFGNVKDDDDASDSGDCSSAGSFFVYQHPIHIPTFALSSEQQYEANVTISSTAIVFNLALAIHLSAMKTDDNYKGTLRKAARLYEYGFALVQQRSGPSALFLTATINNLGVVYQQLEDDERACRCFGQLLSTLMYLTDCQESGSLLSSEFGGFFRNASILIFPDCSGAAPAA